jgi:hypothetical protein
MKKLILILLAVLGLAFGVALAGHGQTKGFASLEAGYLPDSAIYVQTPVHKNISSIASGVFYTDINVAFPVFRYFFLEGGMNCYFGAAKISGGEWPVYGSPITTGYQIGTGFVIGALTIGIEHECTHPDIPDGTQLIYGDAAYDKFYAKYEIKF